MRWSRGHGLCSVARGLCRPLLPPPRCSLVRSRASQLSHSPRSSVKLVVHNHANGGLRKHGDTFVLTPGTGRESKEMPFRLKLPFEQLFPTEPAETKVTH